MLSHLPRRHKLHFTLSTFLKWKAFLFRCASFSPKCNSAFRGPRMALLRLTFAPLIFKFYCTLWVRGEKYNKIFELADLEIFSGSVFLRADMESAPTGKRCFLERRDAIPYGGTKNKTKKLLYRVKIYDIMYNTLILF